MCEECYNDPNWIFWRDLPMNEEIRKNLTVQPPKMWYPSFLAAAQAWGTQITEGLNENIPETTIL